jgi:hypothetical protein
MRRLVRGLAMLALAVVAAPVGARQPPETSGEDSPDPPDEGEPTPAAQDEGPRQPPDAQAPTDATDEEDASVSSAASADGDGDSLIFGLPRRLLGTWCGAAGLRATLSADRTGSITERPDAPPQSGTWIVRGSGNPYYAVSIVGGLVHEGAIILDTRTQRVTFMADPDDPAHPC